MAPHTIMQVTSILAVLEALCSLTFYLPGVKAGCIGGQLCVLQTIPEACVQPVWGNCTWVAATTSGEQTSSVTTSDHSTGIELTSSTLTHATTTTSISNTLPASTTELQGQCADIISFWGDENLACPSLVDPELTICERAEVFFDCPLSCLGCGQRSTVTTSPRATSSTFSPQSTQHAFTSVDTTSFVVDGVPSSSPSMAPSRIPLPPFTLRAATHPLQMQRFNISIGNIISAFNGITLTQCQRECAKVNSCTGVDYTPLNQLCILLSTLEFSSDAAPASAALVLGFEKNLSSALSFDCTNDEYDDDLLSDLLDSCVSPEDGIIHFAAPQQADVLPLNSISVAEVLSSQECAAMCVNVDDDTVCNAFAFSEQLTLCILVSQPYVVQGDSAVSATGQYFSVYNMQLPESVSPSVAPTVATTTVPFHVGPDVTGFCAFPMNITFLHTSLLYVQHQLAATVANSPSECAQECTATLSCVGFTYNFGTGRCLIVANHGGIVPATRINEAVYLKHGASVLLCPFPVTVSPTTMPSDRPTQLPSRLPSSSLPTSVPSQMPSVRPSAAPSSNPSVKPSRQPTKMPTVAHPTSSPTSLPTSLPTMSTTLSPTLSVFSSTSSSTAPSGLPTRLPTQFPTTSPTYASGTSITKTTSGTTTILSVRVFDAENNTAGIFDDDLTLPAFIGVAILLCLAFVAAFVHGKYRQQSRQISDTVVHNPISKHQENDSFVEPPSTYALHDEEAVIGVAPAPPVSSTTRTVPAPAPTFKDRTVPAPAPTFKDKNGWRSARPDGRMKVADFLQADFDQIPLNKTLETDLPAPLAKLSERNRYRNILPLASTRVILHSDDDDPVAGYINANYISDGLAIKKRYIATQGPKSETVDDFWSMIWEQESCVIVMITNLNEAKCHPYWPKEHHATMSTTNYEIENRQTTENEHHTETVLSVFHKRFGEHRVLRHFWYTAWPDHGIPDNPASTMSILEAIHEYDKNPTHPWVVHCSAGIGRTGTFIGIDVGVKHLHVNGYADVASIIDNMRRCRGQMVQTSSQAYFLYTVLKEYCLAYNQDHAQESDNTEFSQEDIGINVDVNGFGQGRIRYVGQHKKSALIGIEFPATLNMNGIGNDGALHGKQLFSCTPGCGGFFSMSEIKRVDVDTYPPEADSDRESIASLEDLVLAAGFPTKDYPNLLHNDPLWLHPAMSESTAHEMLLRGTCEGGDFFVKRRHQENSFELVLMGPDGIISHHKIEKSQDSHAMRITLVDGIPIEFEDCTNVNQLINVLATPQRSWPVCLRRYVPRSNVGRGMLHKVKYLTSSSPAKKEKGIHNLKACTEGLQVTGFPAFEQMTEVVATETLRSNGVENGSWLLRSEDHNTMFLSCVSENVASNNKKTEAVVEHYRISLEDNHLWFDGEHVGCCSLSDLLGTLFMAPRLISPSAKIDKSKFISARSVGDIVNVPDSKDSEKRYDAVILEILPAGTFEEINVDLARVSYSGMGPTERDDCVMMTAMKPKTGILHPEYYHGGSLAVKIENSTKKPTPAPPKPKKLTIEVESEGSLGFSLVNLGWGNYVCRLQRYGIAVAKGSIRIGLKLTEVNGIDVSIADLKEAVQAIQNARNIGPATLSFVQDWKGWSDAEQDADWAPYSMSTSAVPSPVKSEVRGSESDSEFSDVDDQLDSESSRELGRLLLEEPATESGGAKEINASTEIAASSDIQDLSDSDADI